MHLNNPAEINKKSDTSPASDQAVKLLREEISFWQQMLETFEGADHPRETVERAQQALALAQYRLTLIMARSCS